MKLNVPQKATKKEIQIPCQQAKHARLHSNLFQVNLNTKKGPRIVLNFQHKRTMRLCPLHPTTNRETIEGERLINTGIADCCWAPSIQA